MHESLGNSCCLSVFAGFVLTTRRVVVSTVISMIAFELSRSLGYELSTTSFHQNLKLSL